MGDLLANASVTQTRLKRRKVHKQENTKVLLGRFQLHSHHPLAAIRTAHIAINVASLFIHSASATCHPPRLVAWRFTGVGGNGFCTAAIPSHPQPELHFLSLHQKTHGHGEAVLFVLLVRFLALWVRGKRRCMHVSQPSVRAWLGCGWYTSVHT